MRTFCALVLTAALAVPTFAQPPQRGQRGGFGGFGGGEAMLLGIEDVQKDLKLSDEQKEKITGFTRKQTEAMREAFGGGGGGFDREKMQEMRQKMQEETKAFLKDALTEDQHKRLKQISFQSQMRMAPAMAFASEEVASALKVTEEQKEKIQSISQQLQRDMAELRPMRGGGGGQGARPNPETQRKIEALRKEANEKIMEVFTEDQHKVIKELQGTPFEGNLTPRGFGPGGRPGGPGGERRDG